MINTPLPVFDTIPSNDAVKETEPNMRPPENEGPLQVNGYLVPNGDGGNVGGGGGLGGVCGGIGGGPVTNCVSSSKPGINPAVGNGIGGGVAGGVGIGVSGLTESQPSQPLLEAPSNNNKLRIPYANVNPLTATGLYTVSSNVLQNPVSHPGTTC